MTKMDDMENVAEILRDAVEETNGIIDRLDDTSARGYVLTSEKLAAKYRQIMDSAESAIADEYRDSGSLKSAKICEINRNMDNYSITMQMLLDKLRQFEADEGQDEKQGL